MTENEQKILYINLGLNIKEARVKKGYKQDAFATMLKLSRASIVNIEKGRQRPTIHLLYEICKITNSSLFDLLPKSISGDELTSTWKDKLQKSLSSDSKSEKNLSNFLVEVTTKNNKDDN